MWGMWGDGDVDAQRLHEALDGCDDAEDWLRQYMQLPGNALSMCLRQHSFPGLLGLLRSTVPVSQLLASKVVRAVLFAVGAVSIISMLLFVVLNTVVRMPLARYSMLRLTVQSLRDGVSLRVRNATSDGGLRSFGVLSPANCKSLKARSRCETALRDGVVRHILEFDEPTAFSGLFLETSTDADVAGDAGSFVLEGLSADGTHFEPIARSEQSGCGWLAEEYAENLDSLWGYSRGRIRMNEITQLPQGDEISLPTARGETVRFMYSSSTCRLPTIIKTLSSFVLGVGWLVAACLHPVRHTDSPQRVFLPATIAGASLRYFLLPFLQPLNQSFEIALALGVLLYLVAPFVRYGQIFVLEQTFLLSWHFALVYLFAVFGVLNVPMPPNTAARICYFIVHVLLAPVMTWLLVQRETLKRTYEAQFAADSARFHEAFARITQDAQTRGTMLKLELAIASLNNGAMQKGSFRLIGSAGGAEGDKPRHTNMVLCMRSRLEAQSGGDEQLELSVSNLNGCKGQPLTCLDQVYAQAVVLHPILKRKVLQWAALSAGCFARKTAPHETVGGIAETASLSSGASSREVECQVEQEGPRRSRPEDYGLVAVGEGKLEEDRALELMELIEWPKLKPVTRGLDKTRQLLGGDPSRLTDVVRQRIVFLNVGNLLRCIEALCADPEVHVQQIVSSMCACERQGAGVSKCCVKALESGGYRDVRVYVAMQTTEAKQMHCSGHVCQVQLVLADIWCLMDAHVHSRWLLYKESRQLRSPSHLPGILRSWWANVKWKARAHSGRVAEAGAGAENATRWGLGQGECGDKEGIGHEDRASRGLDSPIGLSRPGQDKPMGIGQEDRTSLATLTRVPEANKRPVGDTEEHGSGGVERAEWQSSTSGHGREYALKPKEVMQALRRKTMMPGDYHQALFETSRESFRAASWASVLYSSLPLRGGFCKWQVIVMGGLSGCFVAATIFSSEGAWTALVSKNRFTARLVRFSTLRTRGGDLRRARDRRRARDDEEAYDTDKGPHTNKRGPRHPAISELGLLLDGCQVPMPAGSSHLAVNGSHTYLHLDSAVTANGFYFRTLREPGSQPLDPIGFEVSVHADSDPVEGASKEGPPPAAGVDGNDSGWQVVGSSVCRWFSGSAMVTSLGSRCIPIKGATYATTEARGAIEQFDTSGYLHNAVYFWGRMCFISASAAWTIAAVLGNPRAAVALQSLGFVITGMISGLLLGIIHLSRPNPFDGFWPLTIGLCFITVGVNMIFRESATITVVLPAIAAITCILSVVDGMVTRSESLAGYSSNESLMFAILWLIIITFRRKYWNESWQKLLPDIKRYEEAFAELLQQPGSSEALANIRRLAGDLILADPPHHVRLRRLSSTLPHAAEQAEAHTAQLLKVRSLDLIFLQAKMVQPLLLQRVQSWARMSRGYFACKAVTLVTENDAENDANAPEKEHERRISDARVLTAPPDLSDDRRLLLILWEEIEHDAALRETVKWCGVKGLARSIEKVARSYASDVSRLVDVVRESIVFDSLHDMSECLAAILSDCNVKVLRIKNRFDVSDKTTFTGYRDINVNLIMVCDKAKALGVSGHVCEVQLTLRNFWALKCEEGHRNYVEFRNVRAC